MLGTSINCERSGWRPALQKGIGGCWPAADLIPVSSVPWQPRGQMAPWGASNSLTSPSREVIIPLYSALV